MLLQLSLMGLTWFCTPENTQGQKDVKGKNTLEKDKNTWENNLIEGRWWRDVFLSSKGGAALAGREQLNRGVFHKCGRDFSNHHFSGVKTIPRVPQIALQLQMGGMKVSVELEVRKEGGFWESLTEIFSYPVTGRRWNFGIPRHTEHLLLGKELKRKEK